MNLLIVIDEFLHFVMYRILPVLIFFMLILLFMGFKKKYSKNMSQLKLSLKNKASGVIFGKFGTMVAYSPAGSEGHIAVFGGSGLGKTTAVLIPTLKSWSGTSFTIDISGDICKNVDMPHKLIYEPGNPNSTPYNLFGAIDLMNNIDDQNEALEQLAFLMMPNDEKMSDT